MAKRMSYTTAFKLKVVDLAIKNGNRSAGRKYGVNEKLECDLYSSEFRNEFYAMCFKDATYTQVRLILQQIRYILMQNLVKE